MSPQGLPLEVTDTAIILEGVIAMDGLENVPHVFCFWADLCFKYGVPFTA